MALNKQQKILAGVVGLGALALVVDRMFVGYDVSGPSDASAAVIAQPQPALSPTSQAVVQVGTASAAAPSNQGIFEQRSALAQQLARLGASQRFASAEIVDAFRPSETWFTPIEPNAQEKPVAPLVDWEAEFLKNYQLNAVAGSGADAIAVVQPLSAKPTADKAAMRIGHVIELNANRAEGEPRVTATLVQIDDAARAAKFLVGEELVELKLASPQLSGEQRISVNKVKSDGDPVD